MCNKVLWKTPAAWKGKGIDFVVCFNDECRPTIRNVSSLASTQEEADTKMLLHSAHASKLGATPALIYLLPTRMS